MPQKFPWRNHEDDHDKCLEEAMKKAWEWPWKRPEGSDTMENHAYLKEMMFEKYQRRVVSMTNKGY